MLCTAYGVSAQTIDEVVASVERNSTYLKSLADQAEADRLGNRTGIALAGPEVEFNYLWGSPSAIGNRTDVNVRQSFDLATVFGMRGKVAGEQDNLVNLRYKSELIATTVEAKRLYIEITYRNALHKALESRLEYARKLADSYAASLKAGNSTALEYNKAQLNLATIQGLSATIDAELTKLNGELTALNGGNVFVITESTLPIMSIPEDFETWYAQCEQTNPVMAYARGEESLGKAQVRLSKASNLPQISTGYMREAVVGQTYQGITVGLSLPLWSTHNQVRRAKAELAAAESRTTDTKTRFYNTVKSQYEAALGLKHSSEQYRTAIVSTDNMSLLDQAMDKGAVSLLNYIVEAQLYYEALEKALSAERDYAIAAAELSAYAM